MRLDIVIPAHDEAHRIERTLHDYLSICSNPDTRFFVALDDCHDATADIVARFRAKDPRIEILEYPRLGKGGVLIESFRRSTADLVGFVDADCATPPAEFLRLADVATRVPCAVASRWHTSSVVPRPRPLSRRLFSAGFARLVRLVFRLPYADTQAGAKVLQHSAAQQILPLLSSRDFLFDVDLLLTARKLGFRVVEVPTIWIDREGSRVSGSRDAARMGASLLRLWLHHKVIPVHAPVRTPSHPNADAVRVKRTRVRR